MPPSSLVGGEPGPARRQPARATGATHRQRWAVETMAVAPHDRLLEIGCGGGVAVSLVAPLLTTGTIVAIDRAATMVRLATERNASHISAGRAEIRRGDFESVELPAGHFTKIFAVNVSLFWLGAAAPRIDRMRRLLAPGGVLHVFGERPASATATANLVSTERLLRAHGFETTTSVATRGRGRVLTSVTGTLTS
ncbi:class I SAM-dependent methyltransferase [Micromonospora sp. WMMD812]|uniref:class I SAM-dependent methyltransferase n=1 Tax=Micromonospora sp. WMMD812 TaxID=3015152 RepID=UPI00248BEEC2|nr:class I SAM-dependent methyltransferase [Micromonospora sp. WMMD812]WBB67869.1 class I SAM-dependent methyltransferase [Micromonospora sp. WMMD812]